MSLNPISSFELFYLMFSFSSVHSQPPHVPHFFISVFYHIFFSFSSSFFTSSCLTAVVTVVVVSEWATILTSLCSLFYKGAKLISIKIYIKTLPDIHCDCFTPLGQNWHCPPLRAIPWHCPALGVCASVVPCPWSGWWVLPAFPVAFVSQ